MATEERVPEPPLWEQWAEQRAQLPQGERLQKVLASTGWGSRRVCEELIAAGRVRGAAGRGGRLQLLPQRRLGCPGVVGVVRWSGHR